MDTTTITPETTTPTQKEGFAAAAAASAQAETERKQASRPPRSFTEKLPCKLTPEELLVVAEEVAMADEEVASLEDERKEQNDRYKTAISSAKQRRADLIAKLRSKTEVRDVELIEHFVFETNTVIVRRADTDEVHSERAMRSYERQADLPFQDVEAALAAVDRSAPTEPPPAGDGTEIEDPQAVLDGTADDGSDAPAKRVRRRRKS